MLTTKFRVRWLLLLCALLLLLSGWLLEGTFVGDMTASQPPVAATNPISDVNNRVTSETAGADGAAANGDLMQPALVTTEPAVCTADKVMHSQLQQILLARKQQSYQLVLRLLQAGTKAVDMATLMHQLGGDMIFLAQQRADYPSNPNTLIRFEQQSRVISRAMTLLVLQAIQTQNYQQVLAALQADPAPQQLAWHGQTLLTAILATDPALSPLTLQQLFDHGLQPVFADLVAATALQLPVPLVDTLNMAFNGDRQQLWFHQYRRNNLTLQAAADGNVALYDYWLAQGVPALISAADLNAFDVLPFPATAAELQQRLPMIHSFIKQGLLPRQFTHLTSWLLLLPKDDALLLSQQLASTPQKIAATPTLGVGSVAAISEEIIVTNQLFKSHIALRHHCGQLYQLGSLLLSLDDAEQHYGAALKASFPVHPQQIAAAVQLLNLQQQLELLLPSQQWQPFIRQAQQQLLMLTPEVRSSYILEQLMKYQSPAEIVVLQLQRHYRRFGVPAAELMILLQQNNHAELSAQLQRLPWWQKLQQSR